ncbi:MAG: bifunctional folylpolyglutamate synthase/dihydrofolate synthase [Candidatus Sericytochromatia bacterium]
MAVTPAPAGRLILRRWALLAALGNPQDRLKAVHVAGTNGKGSTVAMLASVLRAAGHRVGRFTSPDLNGPHERFWLDGATLSPDALAALSAEVLPIAERVAQDYPDLPPWRPFDLWCAMAWRHFARAEAAVVVVEAGIGGRADATNIFKWPEATLVTAIGLDHALWLGHDVSTLAREKAGIFRPGVPAMSTAVGPALESLAAEAALIGAPFRAVRPLSGRPAAGGWEIEAGDGLAHLPLAGRHQLENAALVLAAVEALRRGGWAVPDAAVREGLAMVDWPARMERVPDPLGGEWLLDAAHNPEAVRALISSWDMPTLAVIGVQRSKEAAAMVAALSEGGLPLVFVPVPDAECWTPEELAGFASGPTHLASDIEAALAIARAIAPTGQRVVTGSIYLVGAARARLLRSG